MRAKIVRFTNQKYGVRKGFWGNYSYLGLRSIHLGDWIPDTVRNRSKLREYCMADDLEVAQRNKANSEIKVEAVVG